MNDSNNDKIFSLWLENAKHRFPDGYIDARLQRERKKASGLQRQASTSKFCKPEPRKVIYGALRYSGLLSVGRKNAEKIVVRHRQAPIPNLPNSFSQFRILQISDPHFNDNKNLEQSLSKALDSIEYDLLVLTGDYRFRSFGSLDKTLRGLNNLMSKVKTKTIAILGNHDSLFMVPHMEALGITVLLNEQCDIARDGQSICFVGVDDPAYYRLHNLDLACAHTKFDQNSCTILLAHSPDLYQQASDIGFGGYLCGHTHGGQICLPGSIPIRRNVSTPKWSIAGEWHYQGMNGYTSTGLGTSIVEARFFCPAEIVLHTLVSAD